MKHDTETHARTYARAHTHTHTLQLNKLMSSLQESKSLVSLCHQRKQQSLSAI